MRRSTLAGMLLVSTLACTLALPALAGDRPAVATDIENVLTMRVEGTIAVDEAGKVIAHTVDTKIDPRFRDVIDRAVALWKFAPPTVGGKPARVKSAMRVTLVGRKVEVGTEVSVDNVMFFDQGPDKKYDEARAQAAKSGNVFKSIVSMPRMPMYPRDYHVNGSLTLAIRANPDGTIAEVTRTQCSLYFAGGSRAQLARACKKMADIAMPAVRTWKVGIELNGNAPTIENLTATLPMQYVMESDGDRIGKSGEPGNWRMEARTEYVQAPWLRASRLAQRVGTSDVNGSGMIEQKAPLELLHDDAAPRAL